MISRALALFCIFTAAVFFYLQFLHWNLEDGYIVYRISRNIIHGGGWAYNVGQTYNPSTSALNPILLSFVGLFVKDIPVAAHFLCAIYLFICGAAVYELLRRRFGDFLAVIIALAGMDTLAWGGTWGLETMLLCALLLLAAAFEPRRTAPWIFYGFAILARPDAVLIVFARLLFEGASKRKLPIRPCLILVAVLTPWALFSLLTFGEIFPSTLKNKIWQGSSGFWGKGQVYWEGLKEHLRKPHFHLGSRKIITAFGCLGIIILAFHRSHLIWIVIFAIVTQGAYVFLNVPAYHWYFAPFDFAMVVSAGALCCLVPRYLIRYLPRELEIGAIILCCSYFLGNVVRWRTAIQWSSGNDHYLAAAQVINDHSGASGSVAALEVGTLGYLIDRPIYDLIGLTTPNQQMLTGDHMNAFYDERPAIVVLHDPPWAMEYALVSDPRFRLLYNDGEPAHAASVGPLRIYFRSQNKSVSLEEAKQRLEEVALAAAITKDSNSSETPFLCVIDKVNETIWRGESPFRAPASLLRLEGWAAIPDKPIQIIFSNDQQRYAVEATRTSRPDVATHLNVSDHPLVGYRVNIVRSSLPKGSYSIALLSSQENIISGCHPAPVIEVP